MKIEKAHKVVVGNYFFLRRGDGKIFMKQKTVYLIINV